MSEALENLIRNVQDGRETILDLAKEAGLGDNPGKVSLELRSRRLNPEAPAKPVRLESPARAHNFTDVEGFAAYLGRYGSKNTVVFADPETGRFQAVIAETATEGFEIVSMEPQDHPLMRPWGELLGKPTTIRAFVEFLMSNRRVIIAPNARDLIGMLAQIKIAKAVTINTGIGKASLNGIMVDTIINGKASSDLLEIPDNLTIEAPMFIGTSPVTLNIDLLVDCPDKTVVVTASSADMAVARIQAIQEMVALLQAALKITQPDMVFALGTPAHTAWNYAKPIA
jgi:hypothetical protein